MVCCPTGADQFANAARVASAGVGLRARGSASKAGLQVAVEVKKILHAALGFESMASVVHARLASQGGSLRAADLLEGVATVGCDHLKPSGRRVSWTRSLVLVAAFASAAAVYSHLVR